MSEVKSNNLKIFNLLNAGESLCQNILHNKFVIYTLNISSCG